MPYQVIDSFRFGLDTRRSQLTSVPGTLLTLNNAHINQGGEIEKRKTFAKYAFNSNSLIAQSSFGLDSGPTGLIVFTTSSTTGWSTSPPVVNQVLTAPPIGAPTTYIASTMFGAKPFVLTNESVGPAVGYWGGTPISDFWGGYYFGQYGNIETAAFNWMQALLPQGFTTPGPNNPNTTAHTATITGPVGIAYTASKTVSSTGGTVTLSSGPGPAPAIPAAAAMASFRVVAANGGTVSSIKVGTTELLGSAVTWSSLTPQTITNLCQQLALAINAGPAKATYTASWGTNTVNIYTVVPGTAPNGAVVTVTTTLDVSNPSNKLGICVGSSGFLIQGDGGQIDDVKINGTQVSGQVLFSASGTLSGLAATVAQNICGAGTYVAVAAGPTVYVSKLVTSSLDPLPAGSSTTGIAHDVVHIDWEGGTLNVVPAGTNPPQIQIQLVDSATGLYVNGNVMPIRFLSATTNNTISTYDSPYYATALVSGGSGGYTYLWELKNVSTNTVWGSSGLTTPTQQQTSLSQFQVYSTYGLSARTPIMELRCTVTDSSGASAVSTPVLLS